MKTKALTAAQIDTLAQRLSETPIEPSASAKKAGDTFARLLAARIGTERAAVAFTSILTADTADQAEARLTLVLEYGNPDPAGEPRSAPTDQPAAAITPVVGKRQAILDQAHTGALPKAPDFSKPTHARCRAKLAQIVALGEVLRKMFSLAVTWKMRTDNPATSFRKRPETARERFLSFEEIQRLAEALCADPDQRAAGIIRLCMLTGARCGEARTATFDQFNLDLAIWTKQAAYTKQRRVHRVPISHEAVALIRLRGDAVPKGCPFLFPGDVPGQPVVDLKRFWERMRVQAEIPALTSWTPLIARTRRRPFAGDVLRAHFCLTICAIF